MPVQLGSRLPPENKEARIEIIPLIDIMFFLLAAFMLVSLSMVHSKAVKVNLPTATLATPESQKDCVHLTVDQAGLVFLERQPVGPHQLVVALAAGVKTNSALRVLISGDDQARHGDMIRVLELVRSVGLEKVAFEIRSPARAPKP